MCRDWWASHSGLEEVSFPPLLLCKAACSSSLRLLTLLTPPLTCPDLPRNVAMEKRVFSKSSYLLAHQIIIKTRPTRQITPNMQCPQRNIEDWRAPSRSAGGSESRPCGCTRRSFGSGHRSRRTAWCCAPASSRRAPSLPCSPPPPASPTPSPVPRHQHFVQVCKSCAFASGNVKKMWPRHPFLGQEPRLATFPNLPSMITLRLPFWYCT